MSSNGSDGSAHRDPECAKLSLPVDHLLKLLHGESPHRLACWLGLEDAWLLGEWVYTLARWSSRLLFELQVKCTSKFEGAALLQLIGCNRHNTLDDSFHVLRFQSRGFGNGAICLGRSHDTAGGLHRPHRFPH